MKDQSDIRGADSGDLTYQWLEKSDIKAIAQIDRTEHVTQAYEQSGCQLTDRNVNWQVSNWLAEGDGDHSLNHIKSFVADHLERSGVMLGAFDGSRMVGVGVLRPNVRPNLAQLAFLHISRGYRRQGIANQLTTLLVNAAMDLGAAQIYVSATPSESAVGFYLDNGFEPVSEPLPELYSLEPEDIHMIKQL